MQFIQKAGYVVAGLGIVLMVFSVFLIPTELCKTMFNDYQPAWIWCSMIGSGLFGAGTAYLTKVKK